MKFQEYQFDKFLDRTSGNKKSFGIGSEGLGPKLRNQMFVPKDFGGLFNKSKNELLDLKLNIWLKLVRAKI